MTYFIKSKNLILIGLLMAIVGCKKEDDNTQTNLNGEYSGVFERNDNTSKVELTLNNGAFNGQSEEEKFPAICSGTYEVSGNTIAFSNTCVWTADFDWTLILNDEWHFSLNKSTLIMTNSERGKYTLNKQ